MWKYLVYCALVVAATCSPYEDDCGENAEWRLTGHEENTCEGRGEKLHKKIEACRCITDFVRHCGKCIPIEHCPSKCKDPNEKYIFTKYLDPTCDDKEGKLCEPVHACRCIDGFVRHKGKCIKEDCCPSKCPKNEVFEFTKFSDATCDEDPCPIKPGYYCRCKDGLVRHNDECIHPDDCPCKCKDPNEIYTFTEYLDAKCDGKKPAKCKPEHACRCKDGFVRHNDKCIKFDCCPSKCKDPNEEYILAEYLDQTCFDPKLKSCEPVKACRCKKGFVRHEKKCIKACDCPKCRLPNEVYGYTQYLDPTCYDHERKTCKPVKACRCQTGFVRHNGECIKPKDCPKKCKLPHEIYTFTKLLDPTCSREAEECKAVHACRCDHGLVRHGGKCIDPHHCPHEYDDDHNDSEGHWED